MIINPYKVYEEKEETTYEIKKNIVKEISERIINENINLINSEDKNVINKKMLISKISIFFNIKKEDTNYLLK